MKKIIKAILAIAIVASACEKSEKVIDFPRHNGKLVINSIFKNGDEWQINISKSLSALDNLMFSPVKDAKIILYKDGVPLNIQFNYVDEGLYTAIGSPAETGKTYKIEVSSPKLAEASATAFVPSKAEISNVIFKISDTVFPHSQYSYGKARGSLNLSIKDHPGEENYYELAIGYISNIYNHDSSSIVTFINKFSDLKINNLAVDHIFSNSIIISDKFFDGREMDFTITFGSEYSWFQYFMPDSKIFLSVASLSKETYLYKKTYRIYIENQHDPFAEPVRVFNNIQNGYGIFSSYNEEYILLPW